MSDGYVESTTLHASEPGDGEPPYRATPLQRERDADASGMTALDLAAVAEWLPRLGTVLWLERREPQVSPLRMRAASRLLLLEHAAAGVLASCAGLRAWSSVTPQGPREWLSLHHASGDVAARLYLLPDSDLLAWDHMTAALGLAPAEAAPAEAPLHASFLRRALARFGHRWQARLLAFDLKPLPWLHALGAKAPLRISLLGLDLARTIVNDENAEWISPLHTA
ncbi:MAG: hypothetical protein J0L88_04865 [Xanthomonadales bacterium]|nr:hypothetical protein [Xanthomonadales bacterium]